MCAAERERVDAQRWGQVDLVILVRTGGGPYGREVTVVDALCRLNKVSTADGLRARDDGRRTRSALEKRRRAAGE